MERELAKRATPFPEVCTCEVPGATVYTEVLGTHGWSWVRLDACIVGLVKALNVAGFATVASCCGHKGSVEAFIALADGRRLRIT